MAEKEKILLSNTLTKKAEEFIPIGEKEVRMYTCGPTVYLRAHLGNLRAYVFADTLRRTLEFAGYKVRQVMNITDVGHLTSDADEGEDKMQKSAKAERTTAWDIAERYTKLFFEDTAELNILRPVIVCKATDHVKEQIELIKKLEEKGFVYITSDGVYFDTSKFPSYGELANLDVEGLQAGKRIGLGEKRNKTDFALWKFSKPDEKRDMEWDSPWGKGFPGWHIECSAMSIKYLGETFDIHTGGIDHIPIHHTNEIAQAEAANGKKFVNYWLHSNFLVINEQEKMSKSSGKIVTLPELKEKGISPLAYRYLCLNTHYRKRLIFNEEVLDGAANSFNKLVNIVSGISDEDRKSNVKLSSSMEKYIEEFKKGIFDDLNTPIALSVLWQVVRDGKLSGKEKYFLLEKFDSTLGLGVKDMKKEDVDIPEDVQKLVGQREEYRASKQWAEADKARDEIKMKGYLVKDTPEGPVIEKKG